MVLFSVHGLNNGIYQAAIYLFKVSNGHSRTIGEICLKLAIKALKQRH